MNKQEAIKKSLEHSFWTVYPSLKPNVKYCFSDFFLVEKSQDRVDAFLSLLEEDRIPVIPIIPSDDDNNEDYAYLDYI